jgi:hypothetical protein
VTRSRRGGSDDGGGTDEAGSCSSDSDVELTDEHATLTSRSFSFFPSATTPPGFAAGLSVVPARLCIQGNNIFVFYPTTTPPPVQSTAATRERKKQSGFSGNASTVLGVEEARGAERRREAFHTHRHKDTARTLHLVVSRVEEDKRRCVEVLLINHPFTNRVGRLSGDTTDGLPSMHAACLMPASVRFWHVRYDGGGGRQSENSRTHSVNTRFTRESLAIPHMHTDSLDLSFLVDDIRAR